MWNSCTSADHNTCAWEEQELNKIKTEKESKKGGVNMESKAGINKTKSHRPPGVATPRRSGLITKLAIFYTYNYQTSQTLYI